MKIISTTDAIINESWLKFISWNLKLCAVIFVTIVHCECDFCGCSVEARPDGLTVGMWCTPPGRVPLSSILQNWLKLSISFYFCAYANFYPILLFVKAIWKCPPSSVLLLCGLRVTLSSSGLSRLSTIRRFFVLSVAFPPNYTADVFS